MCMHKLLIVQLLALLSNLNGNFQGNSYANVVIGNFSSFFSNFLLTDNRSNGRNQMEILMLLSPQVRGCSLITLWVMEGSWVWVLYKKIPQGVEGQKAAKTVLRNNWTAPNFYFVSSSTDKLNRFFCSRTFAPPYSTALDVDFFCLPAGTEKQSPTRPPRSTCFGSYRVGYLWKMSWHLAPTAQAGGRDFTFLVWSSETCCCLNTTCWFHSDSDRWLGWVPRWPKFNSLISSRIWAWALSLFLWFAFQ